RATLERTCDVIVAGDDVVDFAAARRELEARGLPRILAEGGPTMFGEWAAAGVANELCLSITPKLAGPGARRIATGDPWARAPVSVELTALLEEGGALFCRYRFAPVR
ncbi:MAG: dihydrofolate reductase family protein, partial [Actinomycetota bacterium]|nr:dihydrofolate reductase family protein [Actinomycetota bacterium]